MPKGLCDASRTARLAPASIHTTPDGVRLAASYHVELLAFVVIIGFSLGVAVLVATIALDIVLFLMNQRLVTTDRVAPPSSEPSPAA